MNEIMNRKQKGTAGEREVLDFFWKTDEWAALRTPGSGSARFPSPDIIAGNGIRTLAIECKVTGSTSQYLTKAEIEQLQAFAKKFKAEPWVGVKYPRKGWYFFMLEDLQETGKHFAAPHKLAELKGVRFEELI